MLNADLIGTFVELERKAFGDDDVSGFVVDCNDDLTLLHYLGDDFRLDGYGLIRNCDVTACNVFDSPNCFKHRVFRLKGIRARRPRGVDISTWQSIFETVGKRYPLVALFREAVESDMCCVGQYEASTALTATFLAISPNAKWTKRTRFRIKDLTRLDFGGGYEDALWRVAEEDRLHPELSANSLLTR